MSDDPRFARAAELLGRGERGAARAVLGELAAQTPLSEGERFCLVQARLAGLDEAEGDLEAAVRRWQAVLAVDVDHDLAWANLARLGLAVPGGEVAPVRSGAVASATLDSGVGVSLARFEILGELGRGAFATVYRVRDRALDLPLALKVLHPPSSADHAAALRRDQLFFAQARRIAGLRHPGVVAIYDIDERARTLVMELIAGGTLRDRLRPRGAPMRALPVDELIPLARRLSEALLHVHAQGIVHGDLSPRNVLLRHPDAPVLIDFGGTRSDTDTDADAPAGTPLYLAPEQFQGAPTSAEADLFAAGAILYEAATGEPMRTRDDLIAGRTAARALRPDHPISQLVAALLGAHGTRAHAAAAVL